MCMLLLCAGKTRTILNLLSVVMHSAAKGSLELVPSVAKQPSAALAAAGSSADGDENERQRQWRQASPWMFGEPTVRDMVGPTASTGAGGLWGQLVLGVTVVVEERGGKEWAD